ncbi:TPA: transketolase [Candidatus Woesearchaeota archaeon]|nr:Transketolase [archaeon GW2011_AR15]MBS3104313.1 transketolase [Candidatus Woesearchaeota archaeon]HIH41879.1 transketolase [Candidatus Woesearchaeota archaeon]
MGYDDLKQHAKDIRKKIILMLNKAGSGHTGGSLGMADVFAALYFRVFEKSIHTDKEDRDRFILSNGHINPVWYAALAEAGFIPEKELMTLRQVNSRLQGHPANIDIPLVELSTGSLGQGFPASVGLAIGYKMDKKKSHVFVGLGDGEMEEGSIWEALMAGAHYKLGNLIAFVDRNMVQQAGKTEEMMALDPLKDKVEAFNWTVYEADGHDFKQIIDTFEKAKNNKKGPSFIIFHTHMGQGVSFVLDNFEWHGVAPDDKQKEQALKEIEEK